jgi:hypothetical protein
MNEVWDRVELGGLFDHWEVRLDVRLTTDAWTPASRSADRSSFVC